jgi:hypothetical protein
VPVGRRWEKLATQWAAANADSTYAFNDFHAMMAYAGADRMADARALLAAQENALARGDHHSAILPDVGRPLTQAIHDFAAGRFADAAEKLRGARTVADRFGGSHAQRDVIDQTLIAASARAGHSALADALKRERAFVRH